MACAALENASEMGFGLKGVSPDDMVQSDATMTLHGLGRHGTRASQHVLPKVGLLCTVYTDCSHRSARSPGEHAQAVTSQSIDLPAAYVDQCSTSAD